MSAYPQPYIDYLIYFHAERDFFECHEVMEEFWKAHPGDVHASTYVGLIQIAVSLYHQRRGNRKGAVKMLSQSLVNLTDAGMTQLGLEPGIMRQRLEERLRLLHVPGTVYTDLDLPIADPKLESLCLQQCGEHKLVWLSPSDLQDDYLIHKHTLRDRSHVIAERERSRRQKQHLRGNGHE